MLPQNDKDLISAEHGTGCDMISDRLHNENIGKYNFASWAGGKGHAPRS